MKFPTNNGTRKVWGSQYDSRECYKKSFRLVEKEKKLPYMMEVGKPRVGLIETNIDPYLQEEEWTTKPIKELMAVQVDPMEPRRMVKIGKCLSSELAEQLV